MSGCDGWDAGFDNHEEERQRPLVVHRNDTFRSEDDDVFGAIAYT